MDEGISGQVSRKWKNWYQNEVDEEIKGDDSRDKMKHNEMRDQLFLERMMTVAHVGYLIIKRYTILQITLHYSNVVKSKH